MKHFIWICTLIVMTLSGCNKEEHPYVTAQNDTISRSFLITDTRVGHVRKGMEVKRLYKLYGENNVKKMRPKATEDKAEQAEQQHLYYIYDKANHLLFIAVSQERSEHEEMIEQIIVKDKRFRTAENIGLNASIEQIKQAYKEHSVIQDGTEVHIFIPAIDGYFGVSPKRIKGFQSDLIGDISIDSIPNNVKTETLVVSWYTQNHGVFTSKFWREAMLKFVNWMLVELPSIIILTIIFVSLLRLMLFIIKRVKTIAINRATKDENVDTEEAMKRINTLSGIIHGIGKIFLWTVFLLIMLSKININIAPILASAGIVGLAVGFGAQELVRDFISGFFILLEDQLRTGDLAIINGTTGMVEKIELRTITLRDVAGVVHIFQNGKINTLSNMTKEWSAVVLEIGVAYKEDIDRVMKVMRDTGKEMFESEEFGHRMLNPVEVLGLDSFGDSSINIKAVIKTRPLQQFALKREYQRRLKIAFDNQNIEIPFPHITFYTGDVTKPLPITLENLDAATAELSKTPEVKN
ncbi:MAG: mechanosensitive ion channel family protein [Marinifilaceae bacterium]